MVRVFAKWPGRPGFNPRSSHTKDQEYITFEFVPSSPAVSCMSGWSNLDGFRDGWLVAVQLLLFGVLPPGLV